MTRTVLWLLALVAVSTADSEGRKSYSRYKILSVRASNAAQVDYLNQLQNEDISGLSFFQVPSLDRDIDILVPPVHVNRIKKSLKKQAMKPEVIVEDMQSLIDEESRAMRSARNSYDIRNNYLTYNQIVDWLRTVNSSYPTVQLSDIGHSVENRSIYKVKVASNTADTKPAIWIECLSHAREWITGAVCLGVIDMLTNPEYEAQRGVMLDKFDWHIAPVVNPDGYIYTHDKDRLWRKNRSKAVRGCQGVDLNRNWDISFGGAGTSSYSCSDVYHGPGPISEPENQVLNKAVLGTNLFKRFFRCIAIPNCCFFPMPIADLQHLAILMI
uniref:Peptidase M14 domain-containing protein n=1 Tax=Pinctada fucata TaxID=50426 RepID=A0A194AM35_PINFU